MPDNNSGSGELERKIVLVAGSAGGTAENIVKALLAGGATVIAPSISEEVLCGLRERTGNSRKLYTPLASTATLSAARELLDWLKVELGRLDGVIANFTDGGHGLPMLDISLDTWRKCLEKNLTSHFILAKIFLPYVTSRQGGSYLLVGSRAGRQPHEGGGPVAVSVAGEIMLKDILVLENRTPKVRINSLLIPHAGEEESVGAYCAYLCSDKAAAIRGETLLFEERQQRKPPGEA